MNFDLTDEQGMVVETVRKFVEAELYPHEAEVERTGLVPRELGREIQRKVLELGFYAPNWPVEYGGQGRSQIEQFVFFDESNRWPPDWGWRRRWWFWLPAMVI